MILYNVNLFKQLSMSGFNNYNSLEGIPVYLLSVDDPNATIQTVSLVECPATGLPLYCFEKEEKYKFSTDELKHNIISCIVRVDYPIHQQMENRIM